MCACNPATSSIEIARNNLSRRIGCGLLACLLLVLVASCEDGGTTPSAVPQSVAVVLVQTGVGYQAAATAAFRDGSSREVTTEAQWDSTDTLVATVDALGRITVRGVGTTDITAT
jgi:hypothetical protein